MMIIGMRVMMMKEEEGEEEEEEEVRDQRSKSKNMSGEYSIVSLLIYNKYDQLITHI
jgi:hypothetical protein